MKEILVSKASRNNSEGCMEGTRCHVIATFHDVFQLRLTRESTGNLSDMLSA